MRILLAPERLELVIADISGYTAYLTAAELDHAQNVLQDLLETIQEHLPPLQVVELEGDAVFAWAPRGALDGSMVLDAVRATYLAFRRRVRTIDLASACQCGACRRIETLDLKFVVHSGTAVRESTSARETLTGLDVITVHRLLKNSVAERLGTHGYALFTDAAAQALGIEPAAIGAVAHTETYEHLGDVRCWLLDLFASWRKEQLQPPLIFAQGDAPYVITVDTTAPPQLLWDLMTTPAKRLIWQDEYSRIDQLSPTRGPGTVNHCLHGKTVLVEEILDWHPFSSYALQIVAPGFGRMENSFVLEPHAGGTRLRVIGRRMRELRKRLLWKVGGARVRASFRRSLDRLVAQADTAAQESGMAGRAPMDDRYPPRLVPIEAASDVDR